MKKNLIFLTVLLLLLGCVWRSSDADAQSDPPNTYLPIVDNGPSAVYLPLVLTPWLNSTFGVEVSSLDETVATKAMEAKSAWVRVNALYWGSYQPNNSSEFRIDSGLEQELINADQAGMKSILIIHRTPLWAREYADSVCGPIKRDKLVDFANFMTKVVEKYSQPPFNVLYYELWNEPDHYLVKNNPETPHDESNIPYGCWGDNSAEFFGGGIYADMLKVVTPAVRSVNPDVKIVVGGLLMDCDPNDLENCVSWQKNMSGYFEGIMQAGGGNYFDVVNFHAYNYYQPGTSPILRELQIPNWKLSGGQVEGKLAFLNQTMAAYGFSKPVILSEAGLICPGCSTFPRDYEQQKAEYVVWLYTRNWAKGMLATTWFTMDKGGWRGTGLLDVQNNPTPAYYAFKTMTNTLHGATFVSEVANDDRARIFEFQKGYNVWVLFSSDGYQKSIDLSLYSANRNIEAVDIYGNVCGAVGTDCILQGSQLTFDLPVYLLFR